MAGVGAPDPRAAAHIVRPLSAKPALRLAFEGIEPLTAPGLTLPVAQPNLATRRAVGSSEVTLTAVPVEDAQKCRRACGHRWMPAP
jgi:hypothetical protein